MPTISKSGEARPSGPEMDEELDDAAQGVVPTTDEPVDDSDASEVDAIAEAAGVLNPEGKPLGGVDKVARRDAHRWELDPASAEDAETRKPRARRTPS